MQAAKVSSITKVVNTARGLMPAVFTPLNDDQTLNLSVVPAYGDYMVKKGIKIILVGGTTSENMCLSVTERKQLIDAWVAVSKTHPGLHIQYQVGGAPFKDVIELAKYCSKSGVHSILTLPELYFRPQTVEDLVSYVEKVASAAPNLPLLYYHNPKRSNVILNMVQFCTAASARIPNFKGIKYALNDLVEATKIMKTLSGDQELFIAEERILLPSALMGVKSFTTAPSNLFPEEIQQILTAIANNDIPKAIQLQTKLSEAITAIEEEGESISVTKAAMEMISGLKLGPPSLPKPPVSAETKSRIGAKLKTLGFIL